MLGSQARRLALATQWGEQPPEDHTQTKGKGMVHKDKSHKVAWVKVIGWLKEVLDLTVQDWLVIWGLWWAHFWAPNLLV